jgi:hypothetical protein
LGNCCCIVAFESNGFYSHMSCTEKRLVGIAILWSVCWARVEECAWHTPELSSVWLATFMGVSCAWEFNTPMYSSRMCCAFSSSFVVHLPVLFPSALQIHVMSVIISVAPGLHHFSARIFLAFGVGTLGGPLLLSWPPLSGHGRLLDKLFLGLCLPRWSCSPLRRITSVVYLLGERWGMVC